MKCDHCSKNATVFFMQTLKNGETIRENLCEECALSRGVTDASLFFEQAQEQEQAKELDSEMEEIVPASPPKASPCPSCGFSLSDVENTQRLGCSECYEHFREVVKEMLQGIHRSTQHKGKLPAGIMKKHQLSKDLEQARKELSKAVKTEDYEQAAQLRDQLQELQKQLDSMEVSR